MGGCTQLCDVAAWSSQAATLLWVWSILEQAMDKKPYLSKAKRSENTFNEVNHHNTTKLGNFPDTSLIVSLWDSGCCQEQHVAPKGTSRGPWWVPLYHRSSVSAVLHSVLLSQLPENLYYSLPRWYRLGMGYFCSWVCLQTSVHLSDLYMCSNVGSQI